MPQMADVKISALPEATVPLVGDEVVPENEILDFSNPHCPRCHSLRIRTRSTWASPRSALMRLLTPFASTRVTLCKACGHAWRS